MPAEAVASTVKGGVRCILCKLDTTMKSSRIFSYSLYNHDHPSVNIMHVETLFIYLQ